MPQKNVALLVHTRNEWSRQVLMGIAQYAHENGGWSFVHPKADDQGEVLLPPSWDGDGIICRLTSADLEKQIWESGKPAINVSWLGEHSSSVAKVVSDEVACGEMATQYFLERHFRNYGFIGFPPWLDYGSQLPNCVREILANSGLEMHEFAFPNAAKYEEEIRGELTRWIVELPKPVALIVWTSNLGRIIASACMELELAVPADVSILCIEHDDLASSLSSIPLSNLDQDAWRVGYTAASNLDRMIIGGEPPENPIVVPPLSIVQRRSTEASAVEDAVVREAYRYIHECVTQGLNVDDVVREIGVSRRTLEKKFQENLKMSPARVIRRARLQVVKRLLRETTLNVPQVAERSGFSHPEVLIRAFKKETGLTPTQFRTASL